MLNSIPEPGEQSLCILKYDIKLEKLIKSSYKVPKEPIINIFYHKNNKTVNIIDKNILMTTIDEPQNNFS